MGIPPLGTAIPTVDLDGLPIACLTAEQTVARLARWLGEARPRRVATVNLDFLALARRDDELRRALRCADLLTADGAPLVWLGRRAVPERVAGSELVEPLVAAAARDRRSVYLLGGPDGVGRQAADLLVARHPRLRVAGVSSPFVDLDDHDGCRRIAADVRAAGADLLLVALGCPKQDLFLARHLAATGARVGIGIGCTLELLTGAQVQAPVWMRRTGLEWLFRLTREPRRLAPRYLRDVAHLSRLVVGRLARLSTASPSKTELLP